MSAGLPDRRSRSRSGCPRHRAWSAHNRRRAERASRRARRAPRECRERHVQTLRRVRRDQPARDPVSGGTGPRAISTAGTALRRLAAPFLKPRARILVRAARPPFPGSAFDRRRFPLRVALLVRRIPETPPREPFQDHIAVGPPQLRECRKQLCLLTCAKGGGLLIDEDRP